MTAIVCTYSLYHSCFLEVGQLLFYSIFGNANNFSQLFSASLRIFSQNIKNLLLGTATCFWVLPLASWVLFWVLLPVFWVLIWVLI